MLREGGGAGDACQRKRDDRVVSNGMPSQRVGVCHNDGGRWWIGGGGKSDEARRGWSERWIGWLSVESGGASLRGCERCCGRKRQVRLRRQVELGTQGAAKDQQSPANPSWRAAIPVSAQPSLQSSAKARSLQRAPSLPVSCWNERKMHEKRGAGNGQAEGEGDASLAAACLALGPVRNPTGCNSKGRFQRQIPKAV